MNPQNPNKHVALVTGASRGIGRGTAIRLARDFPNVAIVARTRETLDATAEAIRNSGATPLSLVFDLREPASAEAVLGATLDRLSRVDALVNIAGRFRKRTCSGNQGRVADRYGPGRKQTLALSHGVSKRQGFDDQGGRQRDRYRITVVTLRSDCGGRTPLWAGC